MVSVGQMCYCFVCGYTGQAELLSHLTPVNIRPHSAAHLMAALLCTHPACRLVIDSGCKSWSCVCGLLLFFPLETILSLVATLLKI